MKRRRWLDRFRSERGSGGESLELLLVAPLILAIFAIIVAAARFETGQSKIDQAAGAAARAASQQVAAAAAGDAARSAALDSLAESGAACQNPRVDVDTADFGVARRAGAQVTVTITCTVNWSDLLIPGWPGQKTITSTASSALDRAAART